MTLGNTVHFGSMERGRYLMFGAMQWAGPTGSKKKRRIKEGTKGKDKESN